MPKRITMEIGGTDEDDRLEEILGEEGSGFLPENRGLGRTRRYSQIGDVVSVIGAIGSAASLAKTILEILRLHKSAAKQENVVRIKGADGHTVIIKAGDPGSIAEIAKALEALK